MCYTIYQVTPPNFISSFSRLQHGQLDIGSHWTIVRRTCCDTLREATSTHLSRTTLFYLAHFTHYWRYRTERVPRGVEVFTANLQAPLFSLASGRIKENRASTLTYQRQPESHLTHPRIAFLDSYFLYTTFVLIIPCLLNCCHSFMFLGVSCLIIFTKNYSYKNI